MNDIYVSGTLRESASAGLNSDGNEELQVDNDSDFVEFLNVNSDEANEMAGSTEREDAVREGETDEDPSCAGNMTQDTSDLRDGSRRTNMRHGGEEGDGDHLIRNPKNVSRECAPVTQDTTSEGVGELKDKSGGKDELGGRAYTVSRLLVEGGSQPQKISTKMAQVGELLSKKKGGDGLKEQSRKSDKIVFGEIKNIGGKNSVAPMIADSDGVKKVGTTKVTSSGTEVKTNDLAKEVALSGAKDGGSQQRLESESRKNGLMGSLNSQLESFSGKLKNNERNSIGNSVGRKGSYKREGRSKVYPQEVATEGKKISANGTSQLDGSMAEGGISAGEDSSQKTISLSQQNSNMNGQVDVSEPTLKPGDRSGNVKGAGRSDQSNGSKIPLKQFGAGLQRLVLNGTQKAHIRLDPPNLGEVDVDIEVKDGEVFLAVRVESSATLSEIQSQLSVLREGLKEKGLELRDFELGHGMKDADDSNNSEEDSNKRRGGLREWGQDEVELARGHQQNRATNGRLDVVV